MLCAGGCGFPQTAEPQDPHLEDLGPDQIPYETLKTYSEQMQANYVLFAKRCSKCHTPARPLNARFASRKYWARYVTEMWRRPASGITHSEARRIIDFLVYDAKKRKLGDPEAFLKHRGKLLKEFKRRYPRLYEMKYAGHERELLTIQ